MAVALVTGGAVGSDRVALRLPVESTTAAPGGPAAPVAARPGVPRWTWRDPSPAHTVLPAGQGVVVAQEDGSVVALDGRTGTPHWSYRRAGAEVDVQVSPDGRTVVALHTAGSGEGASRGAWLTVLDADTGVPRWDGAIPAPPGSSGEPVRTLTDRVLVMSDGTRTERWSYTAPALAARSLTDGAVVWTARRNDCESSSAPVSSADVAAALWHCPGGDVLEGLDEGTGARRWEVAVGSVAGSAGAEESSLEAARDGRSLVWVGAGVDASGNRYATPAFRAVLGPLTGAVRGRLDDVTLSPGPGRPVAYREMHGDLADDPLRPEVAIGPAGVVPLPGDCGDLDELAVTATDTTTVRLCHDRSVPSPPLLQVDDRAPEPVGLDVLDAPSDGAAGPRSTVDPRSRDAFAVPAPGAFVVGAVQRSGTTPVGLQ